jgi:coatomer subunit beta'
VLESKIKLRVYKNFKERGGAGMKGAGSWSIDGLHGGPLLGARGKGFVVFWDWESGEIVRRIDVNAKKMCVFSLNLSLSSIGADGIARFIRRGRELW